MRADRQPVETSRRSQDKNRSNGGNRIQDESTTKCAVLVQSAGSKTPRKDLLRVVRRRSSIHFLHVCYCLLGTLLSDMSFAGVPFKIQR